MLFNSLHFVIFFPLVAAAYFILPHRFRWALLLGASYYFYGAFKIEYLLLLFTSTAVSYVAAIRMKQAQHRQKKLWLWLAIGVNLGLLFFFKYLDFSIDSLNQVMGWFRMGLEFPLSHWLLPIGISFYTFQIVGYLLDVYFDVKEPERHPGIYALYVSFFPQLIAGPIERSTNLLPQFGKKIDYDYHRVVGGLRLMLWGFFKKLVIADNLAIVIDQVYADPGQFPGWVLLIATVFLVYQVYCDFSGYSDIAIGGARVFGIELMQNFNRPFAARSMQEFWKRWHISLASWVNDYVHTPLAYQKRHWKMWGALFSIMIAFLVIGIWHGASWNFVIWGLLFGIVLCLEYLTADMRQQLFRGWPRALVSTLAILYTFSIVVIVSIFFRAETFADAIYVVRHCFDLSTITASQLTGSGLWAMNIDPFWMVMGLGMIIGLEIIQLWERKERIHEVVGRLPKLWRWLIYGVVVVAILSFGNFDMKQFYYFQF